MRMSSKFLLAVSACAAVAAGMLFSALPKETPVQKADRAICNQLLKSNETRNACYKVTGLSKNIRIVDDHIVQLSFADRWPIPPKVKELPLSDPEAAGDIADYEEANFETRYAALETK